MCLPLVWFYVVPYTILISVQKPSFLVSCLDRLVLNTVPLQDFSTGVAPSYHSHLQGLRTFSPCLLGLTPPLWVSTTSTAAPTVFFFFFFCNPTFGSFQHTQASDLLLLVSPRTSYQDVLDCQATVIIYRWYCHHNRLRLILLIPLGPRITPWSNLGFFIPWKIMFGAWSILFPLLKMFGTLLRLYFDGNNYARSYELSQTASHLQQGELSLNQYYSKMWSCWLELDRLQSITFKNPEDTILHRQYVEQQRIFKLLASLNSDFEPTQVVG